MMPLSIGLVLFAVAFFYFYKKDEKKVKLFFIMGMAWMVVVSHTTFANLLLSPLENKYPKLDNIPTNVKYIVFLGGDQKNRGWEALRLYNHIDGAKIITSGYAGRGSVAEAIKTAKVLEEIGIAKKDIIVHDKPKDTIEEAKKISSVLKNEQFFLVTSAYHMPRSMMIFENEGLQPIAAPTDFLITDSDKVLSFPGATSLLKTTRAWHEYIGIVWYKIRN
jgi:uncharacterized SAM-binding protein YcdF (DUF218 family)